MPRCPSCYVPMTRVVNQGIKSCTCPSCFGTWLARIALTRTVRQAATEPSDGVSIADLAETVSASDTKTKLRCPECEKDMLKDKFHPMIPVGIDVCHRCSSVWLDTGELALLRALYRELMTSDDPEIVRRREKIAQVMMQWEGRTRAIDEIGQQVNDVANSTDIGFDLLRHVLRAI